MGAKSRSPMAQTSGEELLSTTFLSSANQIVQIPQLRSEHDQVNHSRDLMAIIPVTHVRFLPAFLTELIDDAN